MNTTLMEVSQVGGFANPIFQAETFVRCHSNRDNVNDDYSQIWDIAFEPDVKNVGQTLNVFAAVGQEYLSIIDLDTYTKDGLKMKLKCPVKDDDGEDEELYAVAWSSIIIEESSRYLSNILACGGKFGYIYFIHPCQELWYASVVAHEHAVHSLAFASERSSRLFSADKSGTIRVLEVELPCIHTPTYAKIHAKTQTLAVIKAPDHVLRLLICPLGAHTLLLAATHAGLFSWNVEDDKDKLTTTLASDEMERIEIFEEHDEKRLVDGLCEITPGLIATKSSPEKVIKVWRLEILENDQKQKVSNTLLGILDWSSKPEVYMKISCSPCGKILCAGDEMGRILLFDMKPFLTLNLTEETVVMEAHYSKLQNVKLLQPFSKLEWNPSSTQFLSLDSENEISIDCVSGSSIANAAVISSDLSHVVAGTSNNLITVWKSCNSSISDVVNKFEDDVIKTFESPHHIFSEELSSTQLTTQPVQ